MKKLLLVGICLIALSACQAHNPSTGGAVIGGLTGGLLGNTIGKGDGRTAAIIGGAIVGTIVGAELAGGNRNRSHSQPQQRTRVTVGQCNHISNAGVRAACEQGVAERDRQRQQQAEDLAYQCGRYGHCDPNTYNSNRPSHRTNNVHQTELHCIRPGVWAKDGIGVVKC